MKKYVTFILVLVILVYFIPSSFAGNAQYSIPELATFEFKKVEIPKIQYPSFNYTVKTYSDINMGDSGEHVRELQEKLNAIGYSTNGIDGNYGEGTKAAVIKFQSKNGLEITGVADAATQKVLDELSSGRVSYSIGTQASAYSYEPDYATCIVCEETYDTDYMYDIRGEYICEDCLDYGDYDSCEGCGEIYHIDDLHYVDFKDGYYCEYCIEDRFGDYY